MAYGINWQPHKTQECIGLAQQQAGRLTNQPPLGYLYRFDDQCYSVIVDAERDEYGTSGPYLELHAYLILKKTPKGWKINGPSGGQFVGENHVKQFASPTIKDALANYIARKSRQCTIYQARLRKAEQAHHLGVEAMAYLDNPTDVHVLPPIAL